MDIPEFCACSCAIQSFMLFGAAALEVASLEVESVDDGDVADELLYGFGVVDGLACCGSVEVELGGEVACEDDVVCAKARPEAASVMAASTAAI